MRLQRPYIIIIITIIIIIIVIPSLPEWSRRRRGHGIMLSARSCLWRDLEGFVVGAFLRCLRPQQLGSHSASALRFLVGAVGHQHYYFYDCYHSLLLIMPS